MKHVILFSLVLASIAAAKAQHTTDIEPISPPNTYRSLITMPNAIPFQNSDLLTWIFPDGQFKQQSVQVVGNTVVLGSTEVEWTPYTRQNANTLSGNVLSFVARKGGSGTPPPSPALLSTNPTVVVNASTTPPTNSTFSATDGNCNVEPLWEFSKLASTYLVVSYRNACTSGYVEISYPTDSVELEQYFGFQSETFIPPTITNGIGLLKIIPGASVPTGSQYNIFLKMKPTAQMKVRQTFRIFTKAHLCPPNPVDSILTFDTLHFTIKGGPHDPNYKIVDIQQLPANQTGPVKLTYTIQFHNDGNAPVMEVDVIDLLPPELNPQTFQVINFQPMNGITNYISPALNSPDNPKVIKFSGVPGLPGLRETNPEYTYDQTIFNFQFEVETMPGVQHTFENKATVVFYDGADTLEHIITNAAIVTYFEARPCNCWKIFWRKFFNIFRREKIPPCKKPVKGK